MRTVKQRAIPALLALFLCLLPGCAQERAGAEYELPPFSGEAYAPVHDNLPYFTAEDHTTASFERYSALDPLGRCGPAFACVGLDVMPTGEREPIGMIRPSGWHTVRYDDLIGDKYLFNRCHLIGFQLTGENANEENLITGTRYMNINGMLPFENLVADYVRRTGNHVLYRATPVFEGANLLASGVLLEGYSVEDAGEGICFCVYLYNIQPYIDIDYATGESARAPDAPLPSDEEPAQEPGPVPEPPQEPGPAPEPPPVLQDPSSQPEEPPSQPEESPPEAPAGPPTYVGNRNTDKFHDPNCSSVDQIKESNKVFFYGGREEPVSQGYAPCAVCRP